eukprot:2322-Eustigmatos_ZCMA.PRE.1
MSQLLHTQAIACAHISEGHVESRIANMNIRGMCKGGYRRTDVRTCSTACDLEESALADVVP